MQEPSPGRPDSSELIQREFIRALDAAEQNCSSYNSICEEFDRLSAHHGPRLADAGESSWQRRMLAMRRFSLAHCHDRPVEEREREFRMLKDLAFPHPCAEIDVSILRFGYCEESGNQDGQRESLASLKRLVAEQSGACPQDIHEIIADLEKRLRFWA